MMSYAGNWMQKNDVKKAQLELQIKHNSIDDISVVVEATCHEAPAETRCFVTFAAMPKVRTCMRSKS